MVVSVPCACVCVCVLILQNFLASAMAETATMPKLLIIKGDVCVLHCHCNLQAEFSSFFIVKKSL